MIGDTSGDYAAETSTTGTTMRDEYDTRSPIARDTTGDTEYGDSAKDNWEESSKVGTAGGTVAGAATGAAIGSAGGPVGTVIGGVAGAAAGAVTGAAGDAAGEAAEDRSYGTWNDYENDFRSDYDTNYANSGYSWDQYSLAYRYGYDVSVDPRYEGRQWDEIESTLHGGWDENVYGPWDRFKDAVRHGWQRTKAALT
jgi:hypothetical protein